ncbi:hypothetical protein [Taibaiella koreensis]|uniref:hypothetical protein n=1 Tax=Taibaiella koreensis TaxID=1268548 RepID=UPI000E5A0323|nr:hypothetical protein [Taibaiella koreensis]
MKKLILAASLLAFGAQAKAALFINNNTNCTLNVTMFAFDPAHAGCGGLQSSLITLGPFSSVSYATVATLNTTPPFWLGGTMASTAGGPTTWGWTTAKTFFTGGGGGSVGLASCGIPGSVTSVACGSSVTLTWTTLPGSNNILVEAN